MDIGKNQKVYEVSSVMGKRWKKASKLGNKKGNYIKQHIHTSNIAIVAKFNFFQDPASSPFLVFQSKSCSQHIKPWRPLSADVYSCNEHRPDARCCIRLWRGEKKTSFCPSRNSKLKALNIYAYETRGQESVAAL